MFEIKKNEEGLVDCYDVVISYDYFQAIRDTLELALENGIGKNEHTTTVSQIIEIMDMELKKSVEDRFRESLIAVRRVANDIPKLWMFGFRIGESGKSEDFFEKSLPL